MRVDVTITSDRINLEIIKNKITIYLKEKKKRPSNPYTLKLESKCNHDFLKTKRSQQNVYMKICKKSKNTWFLNMNLNIYTFIYLIYLKNINKSKYTHYFYYKYTYQYQIKFKTIQFTFFISLLNSLNMVKKVLIFTQVKSTKKSSKNRFKE